MAVARHWRPEKGGHDDEGRGRRCKGLGRSCRDCPSSGCRGCGGFPVAQEWPGRQAAAAAGGGGGAVPKLTPETVATAPRRWRQPPGSIETAAAGSGDCRISNKKPGEDPRVRVTPGSSRTKGKEEGQKEEENEKEGGLAAAPASQGRSAVATAAREERRRRRRVDRRHG